VDQPDVAGAALALDGPLDPFDGAVGRVAVHEENLRVPPHLRDALDRVVDVALFVPAGNHDRDARAIEGDWPGRGEVTHRILNQAEVPQPRDMGRHGIDGTGEQRDLEGQEQRLAGVLQLEAREPQKVFEVLPSQPVLVGLGHLGADLLREAENALPQEVVVRHDEPRPGVAERAQPAERHVDVLEVAD